MGSSSYHAYIGPYIEVTATPVEKRYDNCRFRMHCVEPDEKKTSERYCSGCGIDLRGQYVEHRVRHEGRYTYRMEVAKDPREVIAEVGGWDLDSFCPGVEIKPTFDPESKKWSPDDNKIRLALTPNRNEWLGANFLGEIRQEMVMRLDHIGSPVTLLNSVNLPLKTKALFDTLADVYDDVALRYGLVISYK